MAKISKAILVLIEIEEEVVGLGIELEVGAEVGAEVPHSVVECDCGLSDEGAFGDGVVGKQDVLECAG